jgi:hypothetical protein
VGSGQSSIEYLIIVGFALAVLSVLVVVYYEYQASSKQEITSSQIDRLGKKIVDSAEEVYFMGSPTRSTIKAYLPSGVDAITVYPRSLVFQVRSRNGISDLEYPSSVNITGSISATQGIKYIRIIAQPGRVCIIDAAEAECP